MMRVPFEKVPIEVRRRAAKALATLTTDHMWPGDQRRIAPQFGEATPVYRPDLREIAYWEIEIDGVKTVLPQPEGEAKEYDKGFIVVATGSHDVPVPHFSLSQAPPSRQLDLLGDIDRVVKLDSLCYAGQDKAGNLVGHLGTMPPKIEGLPAELPKKLPQGAASTTVVATDIQDGDATDKARLTKTREKRPTVSAWRSWNEVTKGYADSYRLHLALLAERAAPRWETEKLAEEFGEGIRSGQTHTVLLLSEGDFAIEGPGSDLVSVELNPQPLPPQLLLTPKADLSVRDTSFTVVLTYGNGEVEKLPFFIVPEQAPTRFVPANGLTGLGALS
jgi:hypothetical protein